MSLRLSLSTLNCCRVNPPAPNEQKTAALTIVPTAETSGTRLDAFLASSIAGWSRSRLTRLIEGEDVLINGRAAKPSYKVREGDEIEVELTELPTTAFEP